MSGYISGPPRAATEGSLFLYAMSGYPGEKYALVHSSVMPQVPMLYLCNITSLGTGFK